VDVADFVSWALQNCMRLKHYVFLVVRYLRTPTIFEQTKLYFTICVILLSTIAASGYDKIVLILNLNHLPGDAQTSGTPGQASSIRHRG
jgi:hypothetical protein